MSKSYTVIYAEAGALRTMSFHCVVGIQKLDAHTLNVNDCIFSLSGPIQSIAETTAVFPHMYKKKGAAK